MNATLARLLLACLLSAMGCGALRVRPLPRGSIFTGPAPLDVSGLSCFGLGVLLGLAGAGLIWLAVRRRRARRGKTPGGDGTDSNLADIRRALLLAEKILAKWKREDPGGLGDEKRRR